MSEKLKYIRKYLKFIILIIILASIALSAYIVIKRLTGKDKTEKHIQIETVQRAMFMERITELGDLEALEEVEIKSDVGGVIKELYVDNGDYVEKGQELFRIEVATVEIIDGTDELANDISFWNIKEPIDKLQFKISDPEVNMGIIKRLGNPPGCNSKKHLYEILELHYEAAKAM